MTVTNVSTYGSLQTLLQNMSQSQNALNNDEVEISSGEISQTFDGIGPNVQQLTSLNAQVSRLTNYQANNTTYLSQLNTTKTVLSQIQSLATNIKGVIGTQLSGTSASTAFIAQMQSDLTTLTGQLNTSYGNGYLFSGTSSNAPVKTPLPAPITVGTPDDAYYQGSLQTSSVRISDSQEISNNITAANPAFQNIIAGIQQAITAAGSNNTAGLQNAETLISTGADSVIALGATVNSNIVNVTDINYQSQTVQGYYTSLTQNLTQADVVSLSTKVAQDQTQLQATFETFARISQLSLASYLGGG